MRAGGVAQVVEHPQLKKKSTTKKKERKKERKADEFNIKADFSDSHLQLQHL
jgi:ABC-type uncharacterized transport system substrate-binding protein